MADQNYIFISYKGADPEALALIGQLRSRGYRIWCDRSIPGGASYGRRPISWYPRRAGRPALP